MRHILHYMIHWSDDDVIKWKHCPRYWPFVWGIHRSPVNSPHKGQWHGALMFSLICAWINRWVNNREADDLRRHRAHYDVTVMKTTQRLSMRWARCFCSHHIDLFPSTSSQFISGPCFNIKTIFPGVRIPIIKIRRSCDCLIFIMGIPILYTLRRYCYVETTCKLFPVLWVYCH